MYEQSYAYDAEGKGTGREKESLVGKINGNSLVTEDSEAECKEGLEHLHHQEYMEAHICFLKAARAGYAEGQYRLGSLYMYGRGMGADYNLAEIWFHEAEKNGFTSQVADAMKILERFRNGGWKYE